MNTSTLRVIVTPNDEEDCRKVIWYEIAMFPEPDTSGVSLPSETQLLTNATYDEAIFNGLAPYTLSLVTGKQFINSSGWYFVNSSIASTYIHTNQAGKSYFHFLFSL